MTLAQLECLGGKCPSGVRCRILVDVKLSQSELELIPFQKSFVRMVTVPEVLKREFTRAFCIYLDVQRSRADESCSDVTPVTSTYLEPLQSIESHSVDLANASSLQIFSVSVSI